MKSQSLLSQRSNLSQLSNVSYHGQKKQYNGDQFFRQSLPPGHQKKLSIKQLKQQQIQLESLGVGLFKNYNNVSAFTPYWTSELHNNHNIEGTSDNQNQNQIQILLRKQTQPKIQIFVQPVQIKQVSQSYQQKMSGNTKKLVDQNQLSQKGLKNQTKNIPKNYGKAIIIFYQNNRKLLQPILQQNGDDYDKLLLKLRNFKKKINTILDLRNLWQEQPQSKSLRIISNTFLRKYSLNYIYNSRIKTRLCHAKYKRRLQQAILNPQNFNHIKDY